MRGRKSSGLFFARNDLHANSGFDRQVKAFASQKSKKVTSRKTSKTRTLQNTKLPSKEGEDTSIKILASDADDDTNTEPFIEKLAENNSIPIATRSSVLQACIITSGFLFAFGALIRQASHIASVGGWEILDASIEVSFDFEVWHVELIVGLVVLTTTCRYLLLKTWPDFAESSEAANRQVLSLLQPLDYIVVAFLPGISEELLFRGALLPLFGLTWKSALVIGAVFGALHLGSGRRYSFAVWATFVGFAYGLATIISSTVIVPMASHALNNLTGGILWQYASKSEEKSR